MRKLLTASLLTLLVAGITFRLTHHPVYGKCHQELDQRICTLIKWEGNK